MSKVLVDRELLDRVRNFTFLHDGGCAGALRGNIDKALAAQPAEAEGVEVIAYATPNEDGDWQMLFFDEKEAIQYVDDEPPAPLVLQSAHIAALSAVTAERDRLQQFEAAYNEWHDKTERVQKTAKAHELGKHRADVLKDRVDQLQAEVETLRKVIRAALYYVPEHKHDLREIMSAAMAAKEA